VIFTNGLLPERIRESCEMILQRLSEGKYLSVQVSIDGVGDIHNKIRGRSNGFSRAVETVRVLQKIQKEHVKFRRLEAGLVIQPDNVDHLDEVVAFREEMDLPGGYMIQQVLPYFDHTQTSKQPAGFTRAQQERLIAFSKKVRIPGVKKWLDNPSKRPLSCYAGYSAIYIDPYGDVYPCVSASGNQDFVMGNIREDGLDEIWNSGRAQEVRRRVKQCQYTACWSGCEIVQTMIQHQLFERVVKTLSFGYLDYFKLRGIE
ncbi:MAG: SPASM domain-containing protein, partial [Nitrospirota bacterium]|nr:SPASM domain-containing protein [Nitrospirota bacterium]